MLDGLFIASLIGSGVQIIKEKLEPKIPAENWANRELYHQDIMNGVPIEQRMKNLKNGKYKLPQGHLAPHRDAQTGKIVIENETLYREDVKKYGVYQAQQWVNQGKYNLTPEELEKEHERIKKYYDHILSL